MSSYPTSPSQAQSSALAQRANLFDGLVRAKTPPNGPAAVAAVTEAIDDFEAALFFYHFYVRDLLPHGHVVQLVKWLPRLHSMLRELKEEVRSLEGFDYAG